MPNKKVFISGAAGVMGHASFLEIYERRKDLDIVLLLLDKFKNHRLFASYSKDPRVSIVWGNLKNYEDVKKAIDGCSYVLHIGGLVSPKADFIPKETLATNVTAAENIVKAVKAQPNPDEVKVVYIGTVAQTGDRNDPIHWARCGDPIAISIYDHYGLSKVQAERVFAESGLKHWVSLRQSGILHPGILFNIGPIVFHIVLRGVLEWATVEDSATLMCNILADTVPESFWRRFYNIGSGKEYRMTNYQFEEKILYTLGMGHDAPKKIFEPNWFITRNFHGQWYLDSDVLENILHFRHNVPIDEYFKRMGKNSPFIFKLSFLGANFIGKEFMRMIANDKRFGTLSWLKNRDEKRISAYFGSYKEWELIPKTWDKTDLSRPSDKAIVLNHGYDEKKPIEELDLDDMKGAASFRGGECLAKEMKKGDLYTPLEWKCAFGHTFKMTPNTVLKGGHWWYGFRRLPLPIRDLVFMSPFKTESNEIFASGKTTTMFFINEQGEVTYKYRSNSTIPRQSGDYIKNDFVIVRVDYSLNVFDSSSKIIKYSDFDTFSTLPQESAKQKITVTTTLSGGITVSIGNDVLCQTKIQGTPIYVYGPDSGKFNFRMKSSGEKLSKSSVFFQLIGDAIIAIPSHPLKIPSKFEILMYGLPALPGEAGPGNYEDFRFGVHDIHRPFFSFAPLQKGVDPNRPADKMFEQLYTAVASRVNRFPFLQIGITFLLILFSFRLIQFIYYKYGGNNSSGIKIDENNPNIGTFNNVKCSIVHASKTIDVSLLDELSRLNIEGVAYIQGYELRDDEIIIAIQLLKPYDFTNMDAYSFVLKATRTLNSLFSAGIVHGGIDDMSLFADNDGLPLLGGFEKGIHKSTDKKEQSDDIYALGKVIGNHIKEGDPLMMDLISEMTNEKFDERPTPSDIVNHPCFLSCSQRLDIVSHAIDYFQNPSNRSQIPLFEVESEKIVGKNWLEQLDEGLLRDAQNFRYYSGDSIIELLRFIRNKWAHTPMGQQKGTADEYFNYFHRRFPKFFLYLYNFLQKNDPDFSNYCMVQQNSSQ
ncbi:NAD(P)-dependent oxidoreductase [Histomonas meleagridis]|uniref:NAD(P)-dependent oxidoreductase n=1 Tax=Histomonas meleagridis TaxID=135588 RepID=UPI00355A5ACD|nr:NAD(P)-dependent oxidoreductase [Histomonas meleagridis]KAH0807174.1 NAD(P)-dependent oxidoreductase [Histomonas meleagridis]